jgi:hypothetical protein
MRSLVLMLLVDRGVVESCAVSLNFSRTQTLIALLADVAHEFISRPLTTVTNAQPFTNIFQYLSGIAIVLKGKTKNLANEYLCLFFAEKIKD